MSHHVLVLGATGRTGGRVLTQLLERQVPVRAIVRSADRLPPAAAGHPLLEVVELDLLAIPVQALSAHLDGCDTVISCLGHTPTLRGIFGRPRDLVEQAVRNVRSAVEARRPATPVRLILLSSVSVNRPGHADTRRGIGERVVVGVLRVFVPPARDNQRAADALLERGSSDPHLQWVAVRPDTLIEGDVSEYAVHEGLVASLRRPDHTRMANVAHFMSDLVVDEVTWHRWRGQMPVIVDAGPAD